MEQTINLSDKQKLYEKIKWFLNSNYALLLIALVIPICWAIEFPYISIILLSAFIICVFIFCKDNPKAFILPIISFSYVLNTFFFGIDVTHFFALGFILIFLTCLIVYVIRQVYVYKKTVRRGEMFLPFILLGVGNLFAGLIGNFHILAFLCVAFFSFAVYAVYWFCINFLKDIKKYFAYCLVYLSLIICLEILFAYLQSDDIILAFTNKTIRVGIGEINTAAIFMLTGVCASFYLAQDAKKDYLYVLLAFVIDIFIFLTYSRITILIAGIISVVYFCFIFKKSTNKKIFKTIIACVLSVSVILLIVFFDKFLSLISYYLKVGIGSNGRQTLWPWCLTKFLQYPLFGMGYYSTDSIASSVDIPGLIYVMDGFIVNAHNVFLEILCATGIFGLICCIPFYAKKYSMTFKNFNQTKLFVLMTFICGFLSSCFDPTPTLNPFYVVLNLVLISIAEMDNKETENNSVTNFSPENKIPLTTKEAKKHIKSN